MSAGGETYVSTYVPSATVFAGIGWQMAIRRIGTRAYALACNNIMRGMQLCHVLLIIHFILRIGQSFHSVKLMLCASPLLATS